MPDMLATTYHLKASSALKAAALINCTSLPLRYLTRTMKIARNLAVIIGSVTTESYYPQPLEWPYFITSGMNLNVLLQALHSSATLDCVVHPLVQKYHQEL